MSRSSLAGGPATGEQRIRYSGAGAGEGNRTLVFSLEGCCSTIELHPRQPPLAHKNAAAEAHARLASWIEREGVSRSARQGQNGLEIAFWRETICEMRGGTEGLGRPTRKGCEPPSPGLDWSREPVSGRWLWASIRGEFARRWAWPSALRLGTMESNLPKAIGRDVAGFNDMVRPLRSRNRRCSALSRSE
jgi:hypothetical protein